MNVQRQLKSALAAQRVLENAHSRMKSRECAFSRAVLKTVIRHRKEIAQERARLHFTEFFPTAIVLKIRPTCSETEACAMLVAAIEELQELCQLPPWSQKILTELRNELQSLRDSGRVLQSERCRDQNGLHEADA